MSATTSLDFASETTRVGLWNACQMSRQKETLSGIVRQSIPMFYPHTNELLVPAVKVSCRRSHLFSSDSVPCDLLPDFSRLTSDEDREKKAQSSAPGTYHVVVVPESFARLPEYTEDTLDTVLGNPYLSPMSEYSHDPMDDVITSEDPNVVILHQFRDSRKQAYSNRRSYTRSPESDLGSNPVSAPMLYTPVHEVSEDQISESFDLETHDMALFDHFQNVVWTQLIPDAHNYLEANIFEQEASNFPPVGGAECFVWGA